MLTSIAVSMAGTFLLDLFGLAHFSIKPTYVIGLLTGGLIFGVGFALAGYCPGTALCALSEGKKDAGVTIIGGLIGALAYTFVYPTLKPLMVDPLALGKLTLVQFLPWPAIFTALTFALALGLFAFFLPKQLNN
jgi:uncharacterized membrane protein YedE/YeeE